ncbi:MAG TPA: SRPBCC domain-containing protein [Terriglobales bacterium]|nr:SRPBCC domain-containing protein [Terriglobales bacterium]
MTRAGIQDALVSEIHIAAQPERVFQALVDPAQVPKWWGQKGIYVCTEFQADLRVGGEWKSSGVGADGKPFTAQGKYLEINPPRLLGYTWVASWTGAVQTRVRWELSPTATGTQVTIRHSGFAAHPELAQAYRGWPRMLGWLQVFLEKGETVAMR